MALLELRDVRLAFGGAPLLDAVNLTIDAGQRIGLLGRNGAGKSSLLKILAGEMEPDDGEIVRAQGLRSSRLAQEVPRELEGTIFDEVVGGLGARADLLTRYHHLSARLAHEGGEALRRELSRLEHELDAAGAWQVHREAERVISRMGLDPDARVESLSSGMKRRVLLARALVGAPDLLLLDEPTNHLDIDAIKWLEEALLRWPNALVFVTHDRMLLRRLATRIVELDRGRLFDWSCDYETFVERKDAMLEAEEKQQAAFDKRLAQEEAWIRRGLKARRRRNMGRVRALQRMREDRRARRDVGGDVRMQLQEAERSGRLVLRAENLGFRYGERWIFRGLTTTIMRGDKVGVIGPNGSGKTTLLRVLLGRLEPAEGALRHGTRLEVAYFDQLRAQLEEDKSVQENIAEGQENLLIGGKRRHVMGYLQDFLFTPDRARDLVKFLSGGERNRLLLARLFTKPSNVLVLDEPTNDLDMETLELLEERLLEYTGTVLLVSHDRAFLDNVATSSLVFEEEGVLKEYVGGYSDWLRQRPAPAEEPPPPDETPPREQPREKPPSPKPRKLSFNEKRELEQLPKRIEQLEARQREMHAAMADPAFYQRHGSEIARSKAELEALEQELADAYQRWEALEELAG